MKAERTRASWLVKPTVQISLRVAGQDKPVLIPKVSIESREIAPVSMMPEGLLDTLKPQEVLNLVAYLQTKKQVPEAKLD